MLHDDMGKSMMLQELSMAKAKSARPVTPLSIRFDANVRAALDKAAEEDMRPVGILVQKLCIEWLKAHGYLK
jgi:hypothetical protein